MQNQESGKVSKYFQIEVNYNVRSPTDSDCNRVVLVQKIAQRKSGGRKLVTTTYQQDPNPSYLVRPSRTQMQDARTVLFRWHQGLSSDVTKSSTTEQINGQIRLDRQGI